MPQVVDASNLIEFTTTGKVPAFKPPEAPKAPEAESRKETSAPAIPARDEAGKFTKETDGAKSEIAAVPPPKKEIADDDLPEVVRQKIGHKHRQMKEAEEREKAETLRAIRAEREAEELRRQLEASRTKSGPASEPEVPKEPKPEDFKTVAEYTDALVEYRVEQKLQAREDKRKREAAERAKEERTFEFSRKMGEAQKKYADLEEVLDSIKGTDLDHVPKEVVEYMQLESDHGPDLLYHLAKNPDVTRRLQKLTPKRFIAELGKLETQWEKQADTEAKKEGTSTPSTLTEAAKTTVIPVSKAPAPIAPLDTAGIAPVAKKPEDMSVTELREFRRNQEREKHAARR